MWTGYTGPATSPTPVQNIYGAAVVQRVVKAVVIGSPIDMVMQKGSIIAIDPALGKCRLASDPADDLLGILLEDLNFVADETGANIVDCTGAVAKTGCFRMDALKVGAVGTGTPPSVNAFEEPLRLKRIFFEGASLVPATGP
jgi:hypothetical protein